MAGALDFLSNIIGAGTTAQPNPYYGAQLLTPQDHPSIQQPTWVDANGQPITDQSHIAALTAQPALANQAWDNVGFWKGLGTTGKEIKDANMASESYPGQQSQMLAAQERERAGLYGTDTADSISRANTYVNSPLSTQYGLNAIGSMNPQASTDFLQQQADLAAGAFPVGAQSKVAQYGANTALAGTTIAQNPRDAWDYFSNAATTGAHTLAERSQGQLDAQPQANKNLQYSTNVVDPAEEMNRAFLAQNPGLGSASVRIPHIGQDGGVTTIQNPSMSMAGVIGANLFNNPSMTSSGQGYIKPPPNLSVPPVGLIGQTSQPQTVSQQPQQPAPFTPPPSPADNGRPSGLTPVSDTGYLFDHDGNVFYKDGTFVPPENYKDQPIGKVISHAIGLKKAIDVHKKEPLLPHGALYTGPKTVGSTAGQMFTALHPTIGTAAQLAPLAGQYIQRGINWLNQ
jgi:hypothetical protein